MRGEARGVPCRPDSGPGSWQWGRTAAGPVYSAVGLPRSRGKRGCVQGLINHGCFGRDKQARPSRGCCSSCHWSGERGGCTACGEIRGVGGTQNGWGQAGETMASHTRGYAITLALWFHICVAARACKSTFLVWPDAKRGTQSKCMNLEPFPVTAPQCCCAFEKDAKCYVHIGDLEIPL